MKNPLHTICDIPFTLTEVLVSPDSIKFSIDGVAHVIDQKILNDFVPDSAASEKNNLYMFATEWGLLLKNKTMDTGLSKYGGKLYLREMGWLYTSGAMKNVGQIQIPFSDRKIENAVVRFNVREEDFHNSGLLGTERIENTSEAYDDVAGRFLPSLKVIESLHQSDHVVVRVQAMLGGVPIQREGMRIEVKSDAGYLNRRYGFTNHDGIAEFKFTGMLMDKGEVATLKFGYRHYSNIDSVSVTV